eukprot:6584276-Prymnesium_polylepis.1
MALTCAKGSMPRPRPVDSILIHTMCMHPQMSLTRHARLKNEHPQVFNVSAASQPSPTRCGSDDRWC